MEKTAVVAGATGLIGRELVHKLLKDDDYDRIVTLVRRKTGLEHEKLTEKVLSFDSMKLEEELLREADVFCTLGTTMKKAGGKEFFRKVDYEYPVRLAEQAVKHGAAQFLIVTAMGANSQSSIFYNQVKGQVEEHLQALGLPGLQIFRPSLLLGNRKEFRLGEKVGAIVMKGLSTTLVGPLRKYRAIEAATVAEGMLRAARQGRHGTYVYESDAIAKLGL